MLGRGSPSSFQLLAPKFNASPPGEWIHDPAEQNGNAHKRQEHLGAVNEPLAGRILAYHSEDDGGQKGKQQHGRKVGKGHKEL